MTKQQPIVGGWTLVADNSPSMMKEEDSTRIKKVLKEQKANFDVLDLVATQVVSGVNYMYLVYGTDQENTVPGFYFVTVYEDSKGNDSILGITAIDVTSIQTGTPLGKGATGGWAVRGTGKAGMLPDQDAKKKLNLETEDKIIIIGSYPFNEHLETNFMQITKI